MLETRQQPPTDLCLRPAEEEVLNAATHGFGLLLSLFGATYLLRAVDDLPPGYWWACAVYASTLVAVYLVSTLSHAIQQPERKHALRVLDQGVIYLLIAGTYTPLMYAHLPDGWRVPGLTLVWCAAAAGKYSKLVAQRRVIDFSALTYLVLGWLPALLFMYFVPWGCLGWMLLGGVSYTAGTYFLLRDRQRRHYHAVWHLLVILGSALHFQAIYHYVACAT